MLICSHSAGCKLLPLARRLPREVSRRFPRSCAGAAAPASAGSQNKSKAPESGSQGAGAPPAFKAFIDFKFVKDNLELVKENCAARNVKVDCEAVAKLYDNFVEVKTSCDEVRRKRNDNSKAMKGKVEPEERQRLILQGKDLKEEVSGLEQQLVEVENQLQCEGQKIPNLTHPESPRGAEENAVLTKQVGAPPEFTFPVKNHVELGEALDLVDFENASNVSGTKFYYLRNAAALLEMALVNYAFQKVTSKGFTPMMTPDLVREGVLEKCGFRPRAENAQVYGIRDTDLCLTGTAEVPLGGVYMDQTLPEASLPVKMVAYGHCFRTEAGAAGMAGKGLYRVHQFSKVEMFVLCTPGQSEQQLKELLDLEEELFTDLGLHFKILDMPSGDLGAPAFRKFDIEAWMPGLQRFGEISSASNCTDYQSRRLNIRYKPEATNSGKGKTQSQFVHTLNATACAVPRLIVAILENCQQEDGSVAIPAVLQPYMGGMQTIAPP